MPAIYGGGNEFGESRVLIGEVGASYAGGYGHAYITPGVLASNGLIYFAPRDATHVLEVDPYLETSTFVGTNFGTGNGKWRGTVLAPNGLIYAVPESIMGQVLEFNPITKNYASIGTNYGGDYKWHGAAVAQNGKIYAPPYNASHVLEVDPVAKTTTLIGSAYGGSYKYHGIVDGLNGNMYCAPSYAAQILVINTITKNTKLIGPNYGTGTSKWGAGALAPDGKIYFVPSGNIIGAGGTIPRVLVVDPKTEDVSTIDLTLTGEHIDLSGGFLNPILINNDTFCFIPASSTRKIVLFNYKTGAAKVVGSDLGAGDYKWGGSCKSPDGKIFCCWMGSSAAGKTLKIDFFPKYVDSF